MEKEKQFRFDFELYVNENLVCGQNFKITNPNESAMTSLEFLDTCREITRMIKDDLASKCRVCSWIYDGPIYKDEELMKLNSPVYLPKERYYGELSDFETPIEKWEVTFKFVVLDRGIPMFQEIWDGSVYHHTVRKYVDLRNDVTRFGDDDFLSLNNYILRAMSRGKENLISKIMDKIYQTCRYEYVSKENRNNKSQSNDNNTYVDVYNDETDSKKRKVYYLSRRKRNLELINKYLKWDVIKKKEKMYSEEVSHMFNYN